MPGYSPWRSGALVLAGATSTTIAFLLIGGAVGKSAQIPLQTWLPDAMAGPTPVSALIHAATMVTAGVYLISRMHTIFALAPAPSLRSRYIGTVTLLYSGFSALVQRDIKRVLAYSTISQIGYMFLALGVGAWSGAIFHLLTHAFFKALLFLSAGVVIDALHEEHDIFRMGGLKDRLPVACWTFLAGAASLSALPLVTAGFFSKDAIIWADYSSTLSNVWLWLGALVGALITAAYIFRVWFLVFFGERKMEVGKPPGGLMKFSLVALAFFSIAVGYIGWPNWDPIDRFLHRVLPPAHFGPQATGAHEMALMAISAIAEFAGIWLAYLYYRRPGWSQIVARSSAGRAVHTFLFNGWGFDWLYDWVFVRPLRAVAFANRRDFIDAFFAGLAGAAACANKGLSATQTGKVRNYVAGVVLGAIIVAAIVLLR